VIKKFLLYDRQLTCWFFKKNVIKKLMSSRVPKGPEILTLTTSGPMSAHALEPSVPLRHSRFLDRHLTPNCRRLSEAARDGPPVFPPRLLTGAAQSAVRLLGDGRPWLDPTFTALKCGHWSGLRAKNRRRHPVSLTSPRTGRLCGCVLSHSVQSTPEPW